MDIARPRKNAGCAGYLENALLIASSRRSRPRDFGSPLSLENSPLSHGFPACDTRPVSLSK